MAIALFLPGPEIYVHNRESKSTQSMLNVQKPSQLSLPLSLCPAEVQAQEQAKYLSCS